MSALFATLVAAAQGPAPHAEPPPRPRFEPIDAGDAIDWREPAELAPVADGTPPRDEPQPAPRVGGSDAAPGWQEREEGTAPIAHHPAPLLPPIHTVEEAETAPAQALGAPGPAKRPAQRTSAGATAPDGGAADPIAPPGLPPAGPSPRPAAPSPAPAAAPSFVAPAPLLPGDATAVAGRMPPPLSPPAAAPPREDAADFQLRIGRIEVRPRVEPAPAPPRAAPTLTTRAVALPRAAVRQSLDDYRAGRRR